MKKYLILIAALILFTACSPATMRVEPSLGGAMIVRGRQGWQLDQALTYGDFSTDTVRRGWTFSYAMPFLVKFQGARERLSFRQYDGAGEPAEVYLLNTARQDELPLLGDYFSLTLTDASALSGNVVTRDGVWDLLVYRPNGDLQGRAFEGFVRTASASFTIHAVMAGEKPSLPMAQPLGYEFRAAGRAVGAVEVVDGGRVWLDPSLAANQRLVLASVASSLLLRSNLDTDL